MLSSSPPPPFSPPCLLPYIMLWSGPRVLAASKAAAGRLAVTAGRLAQTRSVPAQRSLAACHSSSTPSLAFPAELDIERKHCFSYIVLSQ